MSRKYGVSLSDAVADDVEEHRIRSDPDEGRVIVPRSEAIEELVRIGLVATEVIEGTDRWELGHGRPREAQVRQALLDAARAEADASDG